MKDLKRKLQKNESFSSWSGNYEIVTFLPHKKHLRVQQWNLFWDKSTKCDNENLNEPRIMCKCFPLIWISNNSISTNIAYNSKLTNKFTVFYIQALKIKRSRKFRIPRGWWKIYYSGENLIGEFSLVKFQLKIFFPFNLCSARISNFASLSLNFFASLLNFQKLSKFVIVLNFFTLKELF